jgi:hypothetical protein
LIDTITTRGPRHELSLYATQTNNRPEFANLFSPRFDAGWGHGTDCFGQSNLHSADYAGRQIDPDQMTNAQQNRGGAPVGFLTELDSIEAASVIYLRLWCDGPESQSKICTDFVDSLGGDQGRIAWQSFKELCNLCAKHGRRPLMRHALECNCIGSDESCFANFIATATDGEREDTMLIATLLVRPDVAPLIASLATSFGLALKRMRLPAPRHLATTNQSTTTLH